jgi:hypothetical protein
MKHGFAGRISRNIQKSNFIKMRPVGAELFHADERIDGQTDMMNLTVAFRSLSNAPKHVQR